MKIYTYALIFAICAAAVGCLHAQDNNLSKPLHGAIQKNDVKKVQSLIKQGADVNDQLFNVSPLGFAVLLIAVGQGSTEFVPMFINAGANLNFKNSHNMGATVLMMAATDNLQEVAKMLVNAGADLNLQYEDKSTALMMANKKGHKELALYIQLALDYQNARAEKKVGEFLKTLNDQQRDDVLEMALTQNNTADILQFNKLNPKKYSWADMLKRTAENAITLNTYELVGFLMQQLNITLDQFLFIVGGRSAKIGDPDYLKNAKAIYSYVKANDKKIFGKAMFDYYKRLKQIMELEKTELLQELILKAQQFEEEAKPVKKGANPVEETEAGSSSTSSKRQKITHGSGDGVMEE